jgi:hypothetical protein
LARPIDELVILALDLDDVVILRYRPERPIALGLSPAYRLVAAQPVEDVIVRAGRGVGNGIDDGFVQLPGWHVSSL